jgi:hypothetical protein
MITCRTDICGDVNDDCCVPPGEQTSCKVPGYIEVDSDHNQVCKNTWSTAVVYQCCLPGAVPLGDADKMCTVPETKSLLLDTFLDEFFAPNMSTAILE